MVYTILTCLLLLYSLHSPKIGEIKQWLGLFDSLECKVVILTLKVLHLKFCYILFWFNISA